MAARTTPWSWYSVPEVLRQKRVRSGLVAEGNLLSESEQLVARFQELVGSALA